MDTVEDDFSALVVAKPGDIQKFLSSSLLLFLTSIPAFHYIPLCLDALETARFTGCQLCSSPSSPQLAPVIGKYYQSGKSIPKAKARKGKMV